MNFGSITIFIKIHKMISNNFSKNYNIFLEIEHFKEYFEVLSVSFL